MSRSAMAFAVYIGLLLAGLGYFQRSWSSSGAVLKKTPTSQTQRSSVLGRAQPESWKVYTRPDAQVRTDLAKSTGYLLAAPSGFQNFMAIKKRSDIRDSVAAFDSDLLKLEESGMQAFEDTGVKIAKASQRNAVIVGSSMRHGSSYSSSSSSYSGSSHK